TSTETNGISSRRLLEFRAPPAPLLKGLLDSHNHLDDDHAFKSRSKERRTNLRTHLNNKMLTRLLHSAGPSDCAVDFGRMMLKHEIY
ncbi:MAG: hypothetical protein WCK30_05945, partial [Actinomycetes bacterium]